MRPSCNVLNGGSSSSMSYCKDLVRQYDREHFLVALLLAAPVHRQCYLVTRALNVELASVVGGVVSSPSLRSKEPAMARLAWWRQQLQDMCKTSTTTTRMRSREGEGEAKEKSGSGREEEKSTSGGGASLHPVLDGLRPLVDCGILSRPLLMRLVEAREAELSVEGFLHFRTVDKVEEHGEKIYSSLLYMALQSDAACRSSVEANHAASHLGKSSYLATLIRGIPHHSPKRISYLPADLCAQKKLSSESVFSCVTSDELQEVVLSLATRGRNHLLHAKEIPNIPQQAKPFLLHSVALERFYDRLEKRFNFDVYHPHFNDPDAWLPFSLLKQKMFGK